MELFFASDLHGSLPATKRVLEQFEQSGATTLILLGDTLNHGPRNPVPEGYAPSEVAVLLNQYADSIISVRGNCDSEVDQMLLDFPIMTDYSWVLMESGQRMFITHGHLYNSNKRPPLKENDILVHGHTHIPVAEKHGDIVVFNPGSATFPRDGYPASFGRLSDGVLQVVSFDGEILSHYQD
ncbi:phosphodiesterase [Vibrio genomosp. F10]|uniref:phosphodiesterase n=1 Tax=Vibrio genomosp. F10 TaxID=723171 RepID=UPI0002EF2F6A|nr:phosphodiesterase [Vibrio genomosp. F10]OEF07376.1 YfcE family phosphodiesterase [Vibrio genomosp. F10 str. 9ZB36]